MWCLVCSLSIGGQFQYVLNFGRSILCNDLLQINFVLILNSHNVSLSLLQVPQELLNLFSQAERGIYSVPYHMNKELIPVLVNMCAQK